MHYQFFDWKFVGRRFCIGDVDACFSRLRLRNNGILPKYLRDWEDILIFAAEFRVNIPQNENVARAMFRNEEFPDLKWVCSEYEKLIEYASENFPEKLRDVPIVPQQVPVAGTFDRILEGSVSNTEEKKCSDQPPPTSSITLTSTDSPNCSVTAAKQRSPLPQLSTHYPGQ